MKLIAFVLLVTVATAAPRNAAVPVKDAIIAGNSRIIGGSPAGKGQFPWQVINIFNTLFGTAFCGGALISDEWVLTAAHCADGAYHFEISLGTLNSGSGEEPGKVVVETSTGIVHEFYSSFTLNNDVALVHLDNPVSFSDVIQPIKLGSDYLDSDFSLTVSGWGITADGNAVVSSQLNFVKLKTISNDVCRVVYGSTIIDSSICCSGQDYTSTCSGDSGGPLVQLRDGLAEHVGVVSFVHIDGCGSGNPSGYSRTASFRGWIKENSGVQ